MRRNILYFMIFAAALAAGCSKAGDKTLTTTGTGSNFEFKVSLADIASKSHFVDNPSTDAGTVAALAWDADDDISVTAVKLTIEGGEVVGADFEHAKSCYAKIRPSTINESTASFDAVNASDDWWKTDGDTDPNSMYAFYAIYPARGAAIEPELLMENLRYNETAYGVLIDIPAEQDGKSYNEYHSLFDLELNQVKTHEQLAANTKPIISFADFSPLTCLFHFTLSTGDGSTHTNVDHLKVSVKSYNRDDYYVGQREGESELRIDYYSEDYHSNRLFGIAGTGGLTSFLFGIDALVAANGDYLQEINIDERYSPRLRASTELNLQFKNAPISISPREEMGENPEEYYLVTGALPEAVTDDEYKLILLFEACDSEGNILAVAEKRMPEGGFMPGVQYNFNLVMGHYVDLDGQNAGSYNEVVNL